MGWMMIWWIVPIFGIFMLGLMVLRPGMAGGMGRESPEDILKRRYASGEINDDEYQRRLKELRK